MSDLHRVVSTGIVYKRDSAGKLLYLLLKRSPEKKNYGGKWTVPGGGLEKSDYEGTPETFEGQWYNVIERSLHREIMEEAGILVHPPRYLTNIVYVQDNKVPVCILSYICEYQHGDVKVDGKEIVEHMWAELSNCADVDLIPGIYNELQETELYLLINPEA